MKLRSIATRTWQALAAGSVTLLTGCGNLMGDPDGNWQMPEQASEAAAGIDWVYYFIFWLCVFYFVHIMGVMAYFMWRYRRNPGQEVEESPHHSLGLEIAWSLPPILLCVVMFYLGFDRYVEISTPPANAIKIEVTAKKWDWNFRYHTGFESNELHLPKDKPVVFLMKSRDVLHAFYLPKMRVKKDIVPGRTTKAWTQPNRAGNYTLFCAEYCGTKHSEMRAPVTVHETEAAWLNAIKPVEPGPGKLFQMNCASCHNIASAEGMTGPSLMGIGKANNKRKVAGPDGSVKEITVDAAYLKESIVAPNAYLSQWNGKAYGANQMTQTFGKQLKPEQIDWLVRYLLDPEQAEKDWEEKMKQEGEK